MKELLILIFLIAGLISFIFYTYKSFTCYYNGGVMIQWTCLDVNKIKQ